MIENELRELAISDLTTKLQDDRMRLHKDEMEARQMEEGFVYKRKPLDPNQEFVVVRVPDKLALGQLITEIRGERTMAQLAEQCNVSPSTLSRAVNGKMTKPLSQELIKALAAKSDDPFMLERLVRANGMADAKTCEERKQMAHDNLSLREERLNTERKVKNIISTELLRRGKKIQYMERLEINGEQRSQYGLRWLSSFALVIEDPKPYIWNFAIIPYTMEEQNGHRPPLPFYNARIMENLSGLFLTDAWEADLFATVKNSIVFIDPVLFTMNEDRFIGPEMNNEFSLLLLDADTEIVRCETYFVQKGNPEHKSIFAEPVTDQSEEDDPWGRPFDTI